MSVAIAILVVTPLALVAGFLLTACTSPGVQRSRFGEIDDRWDLQGSTRRRTKRRATCDLTKVELIAGPEYATTTWSVVRDAIGENKERWKELCEQAAHEQDPAKLVQLVKEIRDLLDDVPPADLR
jgi:hypothetical protein